MLSFVLWCLIFICNVVLVSWCFFHLHTPQVLQEPTLQGGVNFSSSAP